MMMRVNLTAKEREQLASLLGAHDEARSVVVGLAKRAAASDDFDDEDEYPGMTKAIEKARDANERLMAWNDRVTAKLTLWGENGDLIAGEKILCVDEEALSLDPIFLQEEEFVPGANTLDATSADITDGFGPDYQQYEIVLRGMAKTGWPKLTASQRRAVGRLKDACQSSAKQLAKLLDSGVGR